MMESQKANEKTLEELKEKEGILICFRCSRAVKVEDPQNDKKNQKDDLSEEQRRILEEDKRAVGKISNNIVKVFMSQKCTYCHRFACLSCLE